MTKEANLEAVNSALSKEVRKLQEELKAADKTNIALIARVKVLKGALEAVAEGGLLHGPTILHDEMLGIVTPPSHRRREMSKHTPGPWKAGRADMATLVNGVESKWIYAGDKYVAVASGLASDNWDEVMANARLIARAPEMADTIAALTARVAELEGALKAELADHEEAISYDRSGLEYASLVGIPLSNADSLAQSVRYHERRAKFIRAAITKGESDG